MNELQPAAEVAEAWERWGGKTQWSKAMTAFGEAGGQVKWYGGFPQSASAIPLCFVLYTQGS